jgi:hypothetical protein
MGGACTSCATGCTSLEQFAVRFENGIPEGYTIRRFRAEREKLKRSALQIESFDKELLKHYDNASRSETTGPAVASAGDRGKRIVDDQHSISCHSVVVCVVHQFHCVTQPIYTIRCSKCTTSGRDQTRRQTKRADSTPHMFV